jgi:hypothetical protein
MVIVAFPIAWSLAQVLAEGPLALRLAGSQKFAMRAPAPSDSAPLTPRHHKSKPRRRPDPKSHSSLAVEALDYIDPLGGSPCHGDHDATMQHENSRSARAAHGIGQRARHGRHGVLTALAACQCVCFKLQLRERPNTALLVRTDFKVEFCTNSRGRIRPLPKSHKLKLSCTRSFL